eukprot:5598413-Amphidinium_carterae.1
MQAIVHIRICSPRILGSSICNALPRQWEGFWTTLTSMQSAASAMPTGRSKSMCLPRSTTRSFGSSTCKGMGHWKNFAIQLGKSGRTWAWTG